MSTTCDLLGKQVIEMQEDLETLGETINDAAQGSFGQAREKASEDYGQGQEKVHGFACACEQFISKQPLRSVLMAAGVGWLLGRFWKRR